MLPKGSKFGPHEELERGRESEDGWESLEVSLPCKKRYAGQMATEGGSEALQHCRKALRSPSQVHPLQG